MYPTFKTHDALHDFPTDIKFYFPYNIQLVNIQNLYELALNTVNCHYTLPHYTKGVIMFPEVVCWFHLQCRDCGWPLVITV
jgi:hypothetical protein